MNSIHVRFWLQPGTPRHAWHYRNGPLGFRALAAAGHVGRVIATTFESLETLRERYEDCCKYTSIAKWQGGLVF